VTTKSISIGGSGARATAKEVQTFTEQVFNSWGVGHRDCNDGLLLFFAIEDRKNHLKTGLLARSILTDNHIVDILVSVKPELRAKKYEEALLKVVDRVINEALRHGRPPTFYWVDSWLLGAPHFCVSNPAFSFLFLLVALSVLHVWRKDRLQAARRASFEGKLKRLQKARDLLSKRGDCREAPCPICLEDLPPSLGFEEGRVEQGCELLRCGHVFHQPCINHWLRNKPQCPVCRADRPEINKEFPGGEETKADASSQQAAEPDSYFWFAARQNLLADFQEVPGVGRVRHGNWGEYSAFDSGEDWLGTYSTSVQDLQREEAAARQAAAAEERNSGGGSGGGSDDGDDWGGGSCDSGGGGGGDW